MISPLIIVKDVQIPAVCLVWLKINFLIESDILHYVGSEQTSKKQNMDHFQKNLFA